MDDHKPVSEGQAAEIDAALDLVTLTVRVDKATADALAERAREQGVVTQAYLRKTLEQAAPFAIWTLLQRPLQERVKPWTLACFGAEIAGDPVERNHRFLEESLELVQACGCTASEAHQLVDYVYGRSAGERMQEVGGVMITLAALCNAHGDLDMHIAGENELARIWTKIDKIRAKQAAKPKHSPLPEAP